MPLEQASLWVFTQRQGVPESKSSDLEGFCGEHMHVSTDICADPWLLQGRSPDDKTVSANLETPQASKLSKIIFENAACTKSVG